MCIDWPLCARGSKDGGGLMLRDASQRRLIVKESSENRNWLYMRPAMLLSMRPSEIGLQFSPGTLT